MQVNSKLRGVIRVPANTATAAIEATALASEKVQPFIAGKTIKKIIRVPRKLVNSVVACRYSSLKSRDLLPPGEK